MPVTKISTIQSGVAGEYFVAAELSRRGCIASITLRNTRSVDILASNEAGTRSVMIQVKTNQGSNRQWLLNQKAETDRGANLFYVFVNLNDSTSPPSFHVVPSTTVASRCRRSHKKWLSEPKRDGTPRKDTPMRVFTDADGTYLGAWERLGL